MIITRDHILVKMFREEGGRRMPRRSKKEGKKSKSKKLKKLIFIAVIAGMAYQYTQLDESKKRFIVHLAKQVPYLPGRYYA
jgi:hypothetical protein